MKGLKDSILKLDRTIVRGMYERSKGQYIETRQYHNEENVWSL